MPELEMVQQVSAKAKQFQKRLGVLFQGEYSATMDVNNARLPEGRSLLEKGGDFILYRFTGSEMYAGLQQALNSLKEEADMLPVMTPEKATYLWMAEIMSWVELLKGAGEFNHEQLIVTIDDALEILGESITCGWAFCHSIHSYLPWRRARSQDLLELLRSGPVILARRKNQPASLPRNCRGRCNEQRHILAGDWLTEMGSTAV